MPQADPFSLQGEHAFVKVLDPRANGSLEEAQKHLSLFIYEKDVVDVCGNRHMHRVIRGLEYGTLKTPEPFSMSLHYLIFEWADCDLRSQIDLDERSHLAVVLRWLHHAATGLQQLHFCEIAHQDIKPANILVMDVLLAYQPPRENWPNSIALRTLTA